jgi:hypothetical protein
MQIHDSNIMRWYDPHTEQFRFQGHAWDIKEIVAAVQALKMQMTIEIQTVRRILQEAHGSLSPLPPGTSDCGTQPLGTIE